MLGYYLFGLGTTHEEGRFITIPPKRRHSTLILRLSRARANDTSLEAKDSVTSWRRQFAGPNTPAICLPAAVLPEAAYSALALPPVAARQPNRTGL